MVFILSTGRWVDCFFKSEMCDSERRWWSLSLLSVRLHQTEKKAKVHGCINSSKFLVAKGYIVKVGAQCMLGFLVACWLVEFQGLDITDVFVSAGGFWTGKDRDIAEKVCKGQRHKFAVLLCTTDARQHPPLLQQRVRDVQVSWLPASSAG